MRVLVLIEQTKRNQSDGHDDRAPEQQGLAAPTIDGELGDQGKDNHVDAKRNGLEHRRVGAEAE